MSVVAAKANKSSSEAIQLRQRSQRTTRFSSKDTDESDCDDYSPRKIVRRAKRSKYQNITNDQRLEIIRLVTEEGRKIKQAARKLGVNYSTAKSICQIYRKEGRTVKKLNALGLPIKTKSRVSSHAPKSLRRSQRNKEHLMVKSRAIFRKIISPQCKSFEDKSEIEIEVEEPKLTKRVKQETKSAVNLVLSSNLEGPITTIHPSYLDIGTYSSDISTTKEVLMELGKEKEKVEIKNINTQQQSAHFYVKKEEAKPKDMIWTVLTSQSSARAKPSFHAVYLDTNVQPCNATSVGLNRPVAPQLFHQDLLLFASQLHNQKQMKPISNPNNNFFAMMNQIRPGKVGNSYL